MYAYFIHCDSSDFMKVLNLCVVHMFHDLSLSFKHGDPMIFFAFLHLFKRLIPFAWDLSSDPTPEIEKAFVYKTTRACPSGLYTGFLDLRGWSDDKSPAIRGQSLL